MENEQYAAIYAAAAPEFQKQVQLPALERYLGGIHAKAGACQPPGKPDSYFANANTEGTTVNVRLRVSCANGPLDENLVFLVDQNVPKLLEYDASSPFVLKNDSASR